MSVLSISRFVVKLKKTWSILSFMVRVCVSTMVSSDLLDSLVIVVGYGGVADMLVIGPMHNL